MPNSASTSECQSGEAPTRPASRRTRLARLPARASTSRRRELVPGGVPREIRIREAGAQPVVEPAVEFVQPGVHASDPFVPSVGHGDRCAALRRAMVAGRWSRPVRRSRTSGRCRTPLAGCRTPRSADVGLARANQASTRGGAIASGTWWLHHSRSNARRACTESAGSGRCTRSARRRGRRTCRTARPRSRGHEPHTDSIVSSGLRPTPDRRQRARRCEGRRRRSCDRHLFGRPPVHENERDADGHGHRADHRSGHRIGSLLGVVARPGQRARLDVADPERLADPLPAVELGRLGPPGDRQVVRRRPQVLADRDDVDADAGEVGEAPDDLVVGLAQADHEPGLRRRARPPWRGRAPTGCGRTRPTDGPPAAAGRTVSTLWLNTSGRAANSSSSDVGVALARRRPASRPGSPGRR